MSLSYLRHQLMGAVADFAVTHPEAWVMLWAMFGLATGVTLVGGVGFWLGAAFGQSMIGLWCGIGWYAYQLAMKADYINARLDANVEQLKAMRDINAPF